MIFEIIFRCWKKFPKPTSLTIRSYIKLNLGKYISKNLIDEQKTGLTKLGGRRDDVFPYFCKESRESMSAAEGRITAEKIIVNMRNWESADLLLERTVKKTLKFHVIDDPILLRKRRSPNYKTMNKYFGGRKRFERGQSTPPNVAIRTL